MAENARRVRAIWVCHYDTRRSLGPTAAEIADLAQSLRSL